MKELELKETKRRLADLGLYVGQSFTDWKIITDQVMKNHSHDFIQVQCPHTTSWLAVRHLLSGSSKGCRKCFYTRNTKWTKEELRIRDIHVAILQRCTNPKCASFVNYGGRGITISEEFTDPRGFLDYVMGLPNRTDGMQLDRIDNNSGYERGNLRWADRETQVGNRRGSIRIDWEGETMSMSQFARRFTQISEARAAQLYRKGNSLQGIIDYESKLQKTTKEKINT
jgi:hypothetical protein